MNIGVKKKTQTLRYALSIAQPDILSSLPQPEADIYCGQKIRSALAAIPTDPAHLAEQYAF
ncbi:hypothetical protein LWM68_29070 [Niabella sp. W65]|nr:hypothetical protein [Niabella sp. W65]MCH7366467.1 hypothetical protein [Niabella sp. W65]ULT42184.1 hypothetical protein KRR40_00520 [Niabella sp. I65]